MPSDMPDNYICRKAGGEAPPDLNRGDFGVRPQFQVAISAARPPEIAGAPRAQPGSGKSGRCKRSSTVHGRSVNPAAMAGVRLQYRPLAKGRRKPRWGRTK